MKTAVLAVLMLPLITLVCRAESVSLPLPDACAGVTLNDAPMHGPEGSLRLMCQHLLVVKGAIERASAGTIRSIGIRLDGATIIGILRDGPAERAKLRAGDVIVSVGSTSFEIQDNVADAIAAGPDTVRLSIVRDGEALPFEVAKADLTPYPQGFSIANVR